MKFEGTFGEWLRQRRKAVDLTQAELAAQIGCAVTTIKKFEGNLRRPSKQIAERIVDLLAIADDERASFIAFARRPASSQASPAASTRNRATLSLPPQPTLFVGRERELVDIIERLNKPTCRLLTLLGPGGIGKTRLAIEAARQAANFGDGIYFVPLASVGSPELVPAAIAHVLHITFSGPDDPKVQLTNYLAEKSALLVLDNIEHLLERTHLLSALLIDCPQLKILSTSRERLNMQEEWVFPIEGLPFPNHLAFEPLESYSAVRLFAQSASRIQPHFSLADNEHPVGDICRAVEGMPLGIELAATWLRVMSCEQIAIQVESDIDFLVTPTRNVEPRHRSLRAVFEQSWNLLSEGERQTLACLTIFRGGFDLTAAKSVADASLSILAALVDKSMIRVGSSDRYEIHELLRQYAAGKLTESAQGLAIAKRHFKYFLNQAIHADVMYCTDAQIAQWDRLEADMDNIRAALVWALNDNDPDLGLQLAGTLGWFWYMRGYVVEARQWLKQTLAASSPGLTHVRAKALARSANLAFQSQDWTEGQAQSEEAITMCRQLNDRWQLAFALRTLGRTLYHGKNEKDRGRALIEESLTLFQELGDQWGISFALLAFAYIASEQGQNERAIELFTDCLALRRAIGDSEGIAWSLKCLADKSCDVGQLERARTFFEESLPVARRVNNKMLVADCLSGLGMIEAAQADIHHAYLLYEESLVIYREAGYKFGIIDCLDSLGLLALRLGNLRKANALFIDVLICSVEIKSGPLILLAMIGLTEVALSLQNWGRAACILAVVNAHTVEINYWHGGHTRQTEATNAIRARLKDSEIAAAYAEGETMTLEQGISYALSGQMIP